jgi:stage V sporulation protein G
VEITEVRIKLMDEPGERLKAFCSITFDNCFVVRDLKIIEGASGPFVAMPSRKLTSHCSQCGMKNHLRSQFCNQCGASVSTDRMPVDADGRAKLYADIAHPINSGCREMIQNGVIQEFHEEVKRSKAPGYRSRYDDFDMDYGETRIDAAHKLPHSHVPHSVSSPSEALSQSQNSNPPTPANPIVSRNPTTSINPTGPFGNGIFPES